MVRHHIDRSGSGEARIRALRAGVLNRVAAALAAMLLAAGCAQGGGNAPADVAAPGDVAARSIMVTTSIRADVVDAADVGDGLACDGLAQVATSVPIGADPHCYEPSLADRARIEQADPIVANGVGPEKNLKDTLEAVEKTGEQVFFMADAMPLEYTDSPSQDPSGDDIHATAGPPTVGPSTAGPLEDDRDDHDDRYDDDYDDRYEDYEDRYDDYDDRYDDYEDRDDDCDDRYEDYDDYDDYDDRYEDRYDDYDDYDDCDDWYEDRYEDYDDRYDYDD